MGIAKAIARVKDGVRQRTSELGEQLHSESIPERLRPAAVRLAALLRVSPSERPAALAEAQAPALDAAPVSAPELPPVLEDAIAPSEPEVAAEAPASVEAASDKRAARRAAIERAATASRPRPAPSAPADSATRPKPTKPARQKTAKRAEGVAAKPGSANSSARHDGKAAAKRPSAKATRKK